jgi:hypothetical protein
MSPITPRSPRSPRLNFSPGPSSPDAPRPTFAAQTHLLSPATVEPLEDVLPLSSSRNPYRGPISARASLPHSLAKSSSSRDASSEAHLTGALEKGLSNKLSLENLSSPKSKLEASPPESALSKSQEATIERQENSSVRSVITGRDSNGRHISLLNQTPKVEPDTQSRDNEAIIRSDENNKAIGPASKRRKVAQVFTSVMSTQYMSPYAPPDETTSINSGQQNINNAPLHPSMLSLRPLQPAPRTVVMEGISSAASSSHVLKRPPPKRAPKRGRSPNTPALHTWKPSIAKPARREERAPAINQATRDFFAKYEQPKKARASLPPDFTFNPPQPQPCPHPHPHSHFIEATAPPRPSSSSGRPVPQHASSHFIHPGSHPHPPRIPKPHDNPDFSDDEAPLHLGIEHPLDTNNRIERLHSEVEALLFDVKKVKTERDYFKTRKDVYKGQLRQRETMFRTQREFVESLQKQLVDAKDKIQAMEASRVVDEKEL